MKNIFDKYIAVDWSARNSSSPAKPSSDAIWIAVKNSLDNEQFEKYFRTRFEAEAYIFEELIKSVKYKQKTLIGYDFDFGFPAGFAKALNLEGDSPAWLKTWEILSKMIKDHEDNRNNRFEVASYLNSICSKDASIVGPFWGIPHGTNFPKISAKKLIKYPFLTHNQIQLREKRWCELREPKAQPVWKLIGSASVGGQSLIGIPMLNRLRFHEELIKFSNVWPFETGFSFEENSNSLITHIEIWPGIFSNIPHDSELIKDQAQVRITVNWFSNLDNEGELLKLMNSSEDLSEARVRDCTEEEGWIIGMGRPKKILRPGVKAWDQASSSVS